MIPATVNTVMINVRTMTADYKQVRVNCIDLNTHELVHSWLVMIESSVPHAMRVEQVHCVVGHDLFLQYKFENKLSRDATYEFLSSDEMVMRLETHSTVFFKAREAKFLELHFLPQMQSGHSEVYFFASETDLSHFEAHQFHVKYMGDSTSKQPALQPADRNYRAHR